MKNNLFCLWVLLAVLSSCHVDDYDYDNLFPEEYNVVFSIKNDANVICEIPEDDTDFSYVITVLKGGAQPSLSADVKFEPWSKEEVEAYNEKTGSNYMLLFEDCYLIKPAILHFGGSAEYGKQTVVTFTSEKVQQYVNEYADKTVFLPLRLISDKKINEEKKEIFITFKMNEK